MSSSKTKGIYIPTNQVWDINDIKNSDVSDGIKELLIRMYQNLSNMATAINAKESAVYDTSEFVTGKVYFPNPNLTSETVQAPRQRQAIRTTVNFGTLPNAGPWLKRVAHNIPFNLGYTLTLIEANATDSANLLYYPLPFVAVPPANNISLWIDDTYVNIHTNGTDRSTFTAIVVIEYLKY
jgi:hypothetical protein